MMVTIPPGPAVASSSAPNSLYRDIFANAVEAIAVIDLEGRYIEQNAGHRRLLGYSDADLYGQTPAIHMGQEAFLEVARKLAESGRCQGEVDCLTKQGERLRIDLSAFTVRDDAGRPVCYVGIKRDITERDRARHTLREHEEKIRLLIENSGDAILIADDDGKYVEANPAACRMFGFTRDELLSMSVADLVTMEAPSAADQYAKYLHSGREAGEFSFVHKDGSVRIAEYSACRFAQGLHLSILRDVTERRAIMAALRRSEQRFRAMFEQSPLSTQIFSPDGTTLEVNRAWEKLWGAKLEDIASYNIRQDRQLEERGVLHLVEHAFHGEPAEIPPIVYDPNETIPGLSLNEDPRRYTRAVIYPLKDDSGNVREVVLTHEDITTRVLAEEKLAKNREDIERLYERLQRAMVETHHRVKNNLQIIAAMIDLRVMDDVAQVPIEEMVRLGTHVRTLAMVHELLTDQAKEDGEGQVVSAQEVLEHLLPLLQQTNIHRRLEFDLEEAFVSSRQATALSLVVNELVSNAQKHGSRVVQVKFSTRDRRAILTVADDGPGFPPDFDPDRAGNTGLELVNRLSRWDLQGDIRYDNRPGGGAVVRVSLPLPAALPTASTV